MTPYDEQRNTNRQSQQMPPRRGTINRHPVLANLIIIIIVAVLGLLIAYLSLGIFTKHGQTDKVPRVVNSSYSSAIETLHQAGFNVEIKDSVYFDNVRPGTVVDQFPAAGATVKPGRKVYLYINALHPKEVIVDPSDNVRQPALRGLSQRQAMAQLQELGFKNIKVEHVLGDTDRVLRVMADGKIVYKMQKVPVNASMTLVVYDGRKSAIADSLSNAAGRDEMREQMQITDPEPESDDELYFEEQVETPQSVVETEEPASYEI